MNNQEDNVRQVVYQPQVDPLQDLMNYKFDRGEDKSVIDDDTQKFKVNSPEELHNKVLDNPKIDSCSNDLNKCFTFSPGNTKMVDKINFKTDKLAQMRIQQQRKLNMFGDYDGDGVINILDCNPFDKTKQGKIHDMVNMARKKGKDYGNEWSKFSNDLEKKPNKHFEKKLKKKENKINNLFSNDFKFNQFVGKSQGKFSKQEKKMKRFLW